MSETTLRTAVLVNVNAIQEYIFSSNKLKENIGASFIIEKKLNELLAGSLQHVLGQPVDLEAWKSNPGLATDYPVGYIGGGNILLFLPHGDAPKQFIREFSTVTLKQFPGLRLSFGIRELFDTANYQAEFNKLVADLKKRKSADSPLVHLPKHGITADCPVSNDAAEVYDKSMDTYISRSSAVKIGSSGQTQWDQYLHTKGYDNEFAFVSDIEGNLGQKERGSYIAVVHIDGNGMGSIFSSINSLPELRKKSAAVSGKAIGAMESMIDELVKDIRSGRFEELNLRKKGTRKILPLRPILVGGDDITFICEGRLGIHLAERYIDYFYDKTQRNNTDASARLMDGACAGVVIVKTHFPFYKAYEMAEELCNEAKKAAKGEKGSSYLSYYYSATTFSGTLNRLRMRTHWCRSGDLYFGPYAMFNPGKPSSLENLKLGIAAFGKWPRNKVMLLRDVLAKDENAQKLFEKDIKEAGLILPGNEKQLWVNKTTPFFDQVELLDFFPEKLLTIKMQP